MTTLLGKGRIIRPLDKPRVDPKRAAYLREWRAKNKERVRAQSRKHYEKNKAKVKAAAKAWKEANPALVAVISREHCKRYREANPERRAAEAARIRAWKAEKRKDPAYVAMEREYLKEWKRRRRAEEREDAHG